MKTVAWIAAAVVAVMAAPTQAHASSCGGSGGGGGGGGSSGGSSGGGSSSGGGDSYSYDSSSSYSSDSGSSSTTTTATPRCTDGDEPVGFRTCTKFGTWGGNLRFPRLIVGLGMAVRQAPSLVRGQTGHVTHDSESFTYRMVGGEGSGATSEDTAVMSTFRLGVGLGKPLYVAADLELGGIASGAPAAEMTSSGMRGSPTITSKSGVAFNALGVVGARGGRGRSSFGVELAGGIGAVNYAYHSQYYACEQDVAVGASRGMLEVRANVERWINPWVNVGAIAGSSLIDRGAWMTGVYLGITTRSFAGER